MIFSLTSTLVNMKSSLSRISKHQKSSKVGLCGSVCGQVVVALEIELLVLNGIVCKSIVYLIAEKLKEILKIDKIILMFL